MKSPQRSAVEMAQGVPQTRERGVRRSRKRTGAAPGTLVYDGGDARHPIRIRVIDYDATRLEERELPDAAACAQYRKADSVTWINVDGVHDAELVACIGRAFDVHALTLEDIVSTRQRPKLEVYPSYAFVTLKMMHYEHEGASLQPEQVSLVFGQGFLLSFQESVAGDVFEPVRQRLRENRGRIRASGADYLAYSLLDVVVDHYMDVLEGLGEHMEEVEDEVTTAPSPAGMQRITWLRRQAILLRRSIWPLREVFPALERSDLQFLTAETRLYLRDTYDHTVRTAEMIESARDVLASLSDLQVSMLSFRLNETMKMLAIIATFFLPLTFIAGVYGMNFDPSASPLNMPELRWYFGYPFALALMAAVAVAMWIYFRRKRWL